jgi:hypothetical protein
MLNTAVGHALRHIECNKNLRSSRVVAVPFDVAVWYSVYCCPNVCTFASIAASPLDSAVISCTCSRACSTDLQILTTFPSSKSFTVNNRSMTLLLHVPSTIMSFNPIMSFYPIEIVRTGMENTCFSFTWIWF